jgi:hypothetical protein
MTQVLFHGEDEAIVMMPREFQDVDDHGQSIITRWQVPLVLGYALTINKSQGLTVDKVMFQPERGMRPGQAYTAVSRVRRLEDLAVLSDGVVTLRDCVVASAVVVAWLSDPARRWRRVDMNEM